MESKTTVGMSKNEKIYWLSQIYALLYNFELVVCCKNSWSREKSLERDWPDKVIQHKLKIDSNSLESTINHGANEWNFQWKIALEVCNTVTQRGYLIWIACNQFEFTVSLKFDTYLRALNKFESEHENRKTFSVST